MWLSVFAISSGASLGAITRWILGNHLNHLFPSLPAGILVANLLGGYLIGVFIALFMQMSNISPE